MKREEAFTLVEMLIVLLIISILILLIVPNIAKRSSNIHAQGCDAQVELVQSQVVAYELDHKEKPGSLQTLLSKNYIEEKHLKCGDGKTIKMRANGEIYYE
ncbi:MAG TPA: competence type IV pilus major pilin ComGC [Pseudogracilibacillus sp.]|nr:competence type IV pilus major pilin ComGC [Pseudogracilibacillus sp.]